MFFRKISLSLYLTSANTKIVFIYNLFVCLIYFRNFSPVDVSHLLPCYSELLTIFLQKRIITRCRHRYCRRKVDALKYSTQSGCSIHYKYHVFCPSWSQFFSLFAFIPRHISTTIIIYRQPYRVTKEFHK